METRNVSADSGDDQKGDKPFIEESVMFKDKNKRKMMLLMIGAIMITAIMANLIINLNHLKETKIGKMIYIEFENGDAEYLEMLLESEDYNKILLFDEEEVRQLIQYMRDNNLKIVPGEYEIPQTSDSKEMIDLLKFEAIE